MYTLSNNRTLILARHFHSSSEDETDSEAGGVDDTVCPPGCDPAHFDQAVSLREQRLDLEELIAEEKRGLESQRKDLEGSKKRLKTTEAHVKTALTDLQVRKHTCIY